MKKIIASKEALLLFMLIFPLVYPYSFNGLPRFFLGILRVATCLSAGVFILLYFVKRCNNRFIILVTIYCAIMLIATIRNHGQIIQVLLYNPDFSCLTFIGLTAAFTVLMRWNVKRFIQMLLYYYSFLIFLNLCSIILFPGGMYSSGQQENYILGFDNTHTTTYFLAIALALFRDKNNSERDLSRSTVLLLIMINISVFLCGSGATVVQMVLFDAIVLFRGMLRDVKLFNPYSSFGINIGFSLFLILIFAVSGNSFIQNIAVNYLHKDATFTSRIYIWRIVQRMIRERQFGGYGFNIEYAVNHYTAYHAHNQYLTELYYGGIPMLVMFVIVVLFTAYSLQRYTQVKRDNMDVCLIGVFFATVFHWNVESFHFYLQLATFTLLILYPRYSCMKNRSDILGRDRRGRLTMKRLS